MVNYVEFNINIEYLKPLLSNVVKWSVVIGLNIKINIEYLT